MFIARQLLRQQPDGWPSWRAVSDRGALDRPDGCEMVGWMDEWSGLERRQPLEQDKCAILFHATQTQTHRPANLISAPPSLRCKVSNEAFVLRQDSLAEETVRWPSPLAGVCVSLPNQTGAIEELITCQWCAIRSERRPFGRQSPRLASHGRLAGAGSSSMQ